jgi:hypothetical protein
MKSLIVYTAITGGFNDMLAAPRVPPDAKGRPVRYICFSDSKIICPDGWEWRPVLLRERDPRRTARWHKTMSHIIFPSAEFTLWHDASHHLKVNPWHVIDFGLAGSRAFATFKHPQRDCVYQEIQACLLLRKDVPARLYTQAERYRREGYPARCGLFETACVARRRSPLSARLNEIWWKEIKEGSCRDQVSLPYAMWKSGLKHVGVLKGCRDKSPYFTFRAHR